MESEIRPVEESSLAARLPAELADLRAWLGRLVAAGSAPLDPEDLVQDVMERALRYAHAYDPTRPAGAWLRTVALRVYLDARARWKAGPEHLGEEPAARDGLPDGTREDLSRLLGSLSKVERMVLVRFHAEGWTLAELAADLALPVGTVKSHLHRARRRLAERAPREDRHER